MSKVKKALLQDIENKTSKFLNGEWCKFKKDLDEMDAELEDLSIEELIDMKSLICNRHPSITDENIIQGDDVGN